MSTWAEYWNARLAEITQHPQGKAIIEAMIDGRRWEEPRFYTPKQQGIDRAVALAKDMTNAGYWERVALRALIMLELPQAEREAMIAKAQADYEAAQRKLLAEVAKGPPTPMLDDELRLSILKDIKL